MRAIAIIVICLLCGVSASSSAAPSLEEIVRSLRETNAKISVLKVEGYAQQYCRDNATSPWKSTPVSSQFTLAIENKKNGRYVLTMNPKIFTTGVTNGKASYAATWYTEFRDAEGFITHWERGFQYHDGSRFLPPRADINHAYRFKDTANYAMPKEMFLSAKSFSGFEALGFLSEIPTSLVSRISSAPDMSFTTSDAEGGLVWLKYSLEPSAEENEVLLDPAKGFGLVRYSRTDKRTTVTLDVFDHRKIAEGVWYPVHCAQTLNQTEKNEVVLTKVTLQETSASDSDLTVNLPEGLAINDGDEHEQ